MGADQKYAFLKVGPWFKGSAKILVAGLPIDNGKAFLGLRILGGSHPHGKTIIRDRENTNNGNELSNNEDYIGEKRSGTLRLLQKLPDIVDLTDDDEPDHASPTLEIEDDDFLVLGEPRRVISRRSASESKSKSEGRRGPETAVNESTFSTGEPYGTRKGVGQALIHAQVALESKGILRDMWNAALFLKKTYKDAIFSVDWFTFENGFSSNPEPKLISMKPYDRDDKEIDAATKRWVYYDIKERIPRGVLVIRIIASGKSVYLLEIQRRQLTKTLDNGNRKKVEEPFKGIVAPRHIEWVRRYDCFMGRAAS